MFMIFFYVDKIGFPSDVLRIYRYTFIATNPVSIFIIIIYNPFHFKKSFTQVNNTTIQVIIVILSIVYRQRYRRLAGQLLVINIKVVQLILICYFEYNRSKTFAE